MAKEPSTQAMIACVNGSSVTVLVWKLQGIFGKRILLRFLSTPTVRADRFAKK